MESIQVLDKKFKPYRSAEEIEAAVVRLANEINRDYEGKKPIFLVVLSGSFIFAADLFKRIKTPCEVSFIKVSSYSGTESTHAIREVIGLPKEVAGREIIVIEDIVDTGETIEYLNFVINRAQPAGLKICTLLFKPEKYSKNFPIDYIGMSIPNDFVVGYGLDYDGFGRNLPAIYQIEN